MSLDSEDRVSLPLCPPDRDEALQMDRGIRNQPIDAARFPRLGNNNRSFVPISSRHIICPWCPITERSHQHRTESVSVATLSILVPLSCLVISIHSNQRLRESIRYVNTSLSATSRGPHRIVLLFILSAFLCKTWPFQSTNATSDICSYYQPQGAIGRRASVSMVTNSPTVQDSVSLDRAEKLCRGEIADWDIPGFEDSKQKCRLSPNCCRRIFRKSIMGMSCRTITGLSPLAHGTGLSGEFTAEEVELLERCLPNGVLYVESDGMVMKAEGPRPNPSHPLPLVKDEDTLAHLRFKSTPLYIYESLVQMMRCL